MIWLLCLCIMQFVMMFRTWPNDCLQRHLTLITVHLKLQGWNRSHCGVWASLTYCGYNFPHCGCWLSRCHRRPRCSPPSGQVLLSLTKQQLVPAGCCVPLQHGSPRMTLGNIECLVLFNYSADWLCKTEYTLFCILTQNAKFRIMIQMRKSTGRGRFILYAGK